MPMKIKLLCFVCVIAFCTAVIMLARFLGLNENQTYCFTFGAYMVAFGVLGIKTQSGRAVEKQLASVIIWLGVIAFAAIPFL